MKCSLRFKIMGLFLVSFAVLIAMFLILSIRQNLRAQEGRNKAVFQTDTIALQGTIDRQRPQLEKIALNLLNTDELFSFLGDPQDENARMVLEGLFLSFQEQGVRRFTLYSPSGELLVEQVKNVSRRQTNLPDTLRGVYEQAEQDFEFHYYYRGIEGAGKVFPVEFCLVTVVTDDDDETIGFAEIALDAKRWLTSLAELTGNITTLWNPEAHSYTLTSDEAFLAKIQGGDLTENGKKQFATTKTAASWYLTDIVPLQGVDDAVLSYLLISRDATDYMEKERQSFIVTIVLSGSIVVLALVVSSVVVHRGVIMPIMQVISFAGEMAKGNFTKSISVKTRCEVASMAEALNEMAEQIRSRAREAEAIATGDLTLSIIPHSEQDVLGNSLAKIIDNLGKVISLVRDDSTLLRKNSKEIREFAEEIRNSSEIINSRSSAISDVSENIAEDIEKLASATEEMSASVKEISENTSRSKVVSADATRLSQQASSAMARLDESAMKIEKASGAISEFADQTSLLALNATIEAARAGEAGKGFAVVASEVKELATRSIATAKSISQDIEEILKFTESAVSQTNNVAESIKSLDESSMIVAASLTEQSSVADDLAGTISGTFEQVKTFSHNLGDISLSIEQNNNVIQSLSLSSEQMAELSGRLKEAVGTFKLS